MFNIESVSVNSITNMPPRWGSDGISADSLQTCRLYEALT